MRISDWSSDVCSSDLAVQQPKGINALNQYCLKAFQEYGVPFNPDYNGKSQIGVSPVQSTIGNQRRCSAVDAYLRPHLASGRVTLLTEKTVVRVLVENGRAVGVQLSSKGFEAIMARQVVLSDRKSTRLNSSHYLASRMPPSA